MSYVPRYNSKFAKSGKRIFFKRTTRKPKANKTIKAKGKSFTNLSGGIGINNSLNQEFNKLTTNTSFPIPNKWVMNLSYGVNEVLTILGSDNKWRGGQYNTTNIFDPEVTNLGRNGQPYGFDQISQFYNRYVVTSVKYDLTYRCGKADGGIVPGMYGAIAVRNESDGAAFMAGRALDYPLERTGNVVKPLPNDTGMTRFKGSINNYKILAMSSFDNFLETSSATTSGGPVTGDNVYFETIAIDPSAYTYDKFVRVTGVIVYKVMFYDPKGVAQS